MTKNTTAASATPMPDAPPPMPEGAELVTTTGKLTGTPLYKVSGFEMPWASSEREAIRVYDTLRHAYANGYFGGVAKREASRPH